MASEQYEMDKELSEDRSSATSNADQFDERSFDDVTAISDQEVVSQAPFEVEESSELPQPSTEFAQPVLSKQELDHIAYITSLAEHSISYLDDLEEAPLLSSDSSEKPDWEKQFSEDRSSATSIADQFETGFANAYETADQENLAEGLIHPTKRSEMLQPFVRSEKSLLLEKADASRVLNLAKFQLNNGRTGSFPCVRCVMFSLRRSKSAPFIPLPTSSGRSDHKVTSLLPYTTKRSASEYSFELENWRREVLRGSASHGEVRSKRPNAYEICEQHSFKEPRYLLSNVDLLWRLNFAANRLTEVIADDAARDLRIFYRHANNPRARYFSDAPMSVESEEESAEGRADLGYVVEPLPKDGSSSFGLFSFFSQKKSLTDRPRSALALFSSANINTGMRKDSEDRSAGDILNLLRRSSGADPRLQSESPTSRLPDNALVGLSEAERQHIISVISRSNKSSSPITSRRCSSALQMLPEMDTLSDTEREHIQNVIEKAEGRTPYVIKNPQKNPSIPRWSNDFEASELTIREVPSESPVKTDQADSISTRRSTSALRVVPPPIAISQPTPPHSARTDSSRRSSETPNFGFSTPSVAGVKSFFERASNTVRSAAENLTEKSEEKMGLTQEELDHIARINRMAEEMETQPELTEEELAHITKVAQMAEIEEERMAVPVPREFKPQPKPTKKQAETELTAEELAHIARIAQMAEEQESTPVAVRRKDKIEAVETKAREPVEPGLTEEELAHIARIAQLAEIENVAPPPVKISGPSDMRKEKVEPGLTEEELAHIVRISQLAEEEDVAPNGFREIVQSGLTDEELAHISRIAQMAEMEDVAPQNVGREVKAREEVEPELTDEELAHIARVSQLAEEERMTEPLNRFMVVEPRKDSENDLTEEELAHIARIAEMAEMEGFTQPRPVLEPEYLEPIRTVAEPELTDEVLAHNARIAEMAEMERFTQPRTVVEPAYLEPIRTVAEPELTAEELAHISRIAELAEMEGTPQPVEETKEVEPDLTEEELAHIARIAQLAEEEGIAQSMPSDRSISEKGKVDLQPELTEEELAHIAKISQIAELEGLTSSKPTIIEEVPEVHSSELTQEELEHIARITQMAEVEAQVTTMYPRMPLPVPPKRDSNKMVPETSPTSSQERNRFASHASSISPDDTSRRIPEEGSHDGISMHSSSSRGSIHSHRSSDFDIRSVSEMRNAKNLGEWYEEQLSFIRQSIADEEELFENAEDLTTPTRLEEELTPKDEVPPSDIGFAGREESMSESEKPQLGGIDSVAGGVPTQQHSSSFTAFPIASSAKEKGAEEQYLVDAAPEPESSSINVNAARREPRERSPFVTQSLVDEELPAESPGMASALPPMDGLTEEEQRKILAVMAAAEMDDFNMMPTPQPTRSLAPPATSMPIPPGLEGLSEEERMQIMAVMANAEMDEARNQPLSKMTSRSPSYNIMPTSPLPPKQFEPPGLEGLSEEEKRKIMAVMANAEMEEVQTLPLPPTRPTSVASTAPPGLEDLSEEERFKIMSVIANAEFEDARSALNSPSQGFKPISAARTPSPARESLPDLSGLSEEEREQIRAVTAKANLDLEPSNWRPSPQTSAAVSPAQQRDVDFGLEGLSEEERRQIMAVMSRAAEEPPAAPVEAIPEERAISPISEEIIRTSEPDEHYVESSEVAVQPEDFEIATRVDSREDEMRYGTRMEPSSPTRESGYATTSTTYEKELFDVVHEKANEDVLDDSSQIREGARSRRDSIEYPERPERALSPDLKAKNDDFDFTYSDSRFAGIMHFDDIESAEEQKEVEELEEEEEKKEDKNEWDSRRMWTTVFESDESELPHHEQDFSKTQERDQSRAVGLGTSQGASEVEEKKISGLRNGPSTFTRTTALTSLSSTPEIKITTEEEPKSDSEDEESVSEDDEEYPDKVVAAPIAPAPTFEEVERERIRQEELGKEVLQQIQAFGEAANDEFDVQWANSNLVKNENSPTAPAAASTTTPEITFSEEEMLFQTARPPEIGKFQPVRNPFLDSPEDEEVTINMEDVDYNEVAKFYETHSQMMRRPGPVYTIAEDESEDDGTLSNSESRLNAREKRQKKSADNILAKYDRPKKSTESTTVAAPATTYAIINLSERPPPLTITSETSPFFSSPNSIPTSGVAPFFSPQEVNDVPSEIYTSIDKTMAEVEDLLGQVYTNASAKPNLLCYDQSSFAIPTASNENKATQEKMSNGETSPSFLLPLQKSTLGSFLDSVAAEPEILSPRGLKRSPGMLLPSQEPLASLSSFSAKTVDEQPSEVPNTIDGLANAYKWLQDIEDDGSAASATEMGRRKLPSIPATSTGPPSLQTPLSMTIQAPLSNSVVGHFVDDYSTSLPQDPIVPETLLRGSSLPRRQTQSQTTPPVYITSSRTTVSPAVSTTNVFTSVPSTSAGIVSGLDSRPTSSMSIYQDISRPASAASNVSIYPSTSNINPAILPGAAYTSRVPHLRQPVSLRPSTSTTTSQIRPSTARIPNTLARVLLKKELKDVLMQRKVRLEASEIEANQRQYKVQKMIVTGLLPEKPEDDIPRVVKCDLPLEITRDVHIAKLPQVQPNRRETHTPTARRYAAAQSTPMTSKLGATSSQSVATQANEENIHQMRTTSLRTQLEFEKRPNLMTYVGKRSAETQTDTANPTLDYRSNILSGSYPRIQKDRQSRRDRNEQSRSYHSDLLEITKQYFEDYDRQLRELGEKAKRSQRRRFDFHDDEDAESRKSQVLSELARRRERMCASCEVLHEVEPFQTTNAMSSDYSSHVPHYGSLPRIDYPRVRTDSTRDFTYRGAPEPVAPYYNYGSLPRNFERYNVEPIQIENEQSFGAPPARYNSFTAFDMNLPQSTSSMYGRPGTAYYDSYADGNANTKRLGTSNFPYANDTMNMTVPQQHPDFVSQYASFLNSQFLTGLQSAANLPQPMMPLTRYDAPLSEPRQGMTTNFDNHFDPLMLSDPMRAAHVYSRNETNYGSRPAQQSLMDYGNVRKPYSAVVPIKPYGSRKELYDVPNLQKQQHHQQLLQQQQLLRRQQQELYALPPGEPIARVGFGDVSDYWPRDDALSRVYASAGRRRSQVPSNNYRSLSNRTRPRVDYDTGTTRSEPFSGHQRHRGRYEEERRPEVKRILLTRRYRHHNIYNDLGVRVVGGKRQKDGQLAAYVSAVNSKMNNQTLGQIKLGDEVLEWNGILLREKTFEEVERIINSSQGEVEVIIRSVNQLGAPGRVSEDQHRYLRSDELSPDRAPPVPMHRVNGNNNNLPHASFSDSSCGHIQVALSYDRSSSLLTVQVLRARGLKARDTSRTAPNPFVKVYLLPGRKVSHKRRTRFVDSSCDPEWNQLLEYHVPPQLLSTMFLEFSVCDYEKDTNDVPLGHVQISLGDSNALSASARWYAIQPEMSQSRTSRRCYEQHEEDLRRAAHIFPSYNPASLDIGYPAIN